MGTGTALPDAFNLSIICKVFGVSADYLINDDVTENAAENVSAAFNSDDDGASFIMVENSIPYRCRKAVPAICTAAQKKRTAVPAVQNPTLSAADCIFTR